MFTFTEKNHTLIQQHLGKYPEDRKQSALLPILDIAQRQNGGWLSHEALEAVAKTLEIPVLKVWEVASFYTMYHLHPVGKYHIQVCGTTPCLLRGAEALRDTCANHLNIAMKEVTNDGLFSLEEVECLGACVNAPVVQINDHYYEDLNDITMIELLERCKREGLPPPYSACGRQGSSPLPISSEEEDHGLPRGGFDAQNK